MISLKPFWLKKKLPLIWVEFGVLWGQNLERRDFSVLFWLLIQLGHKVCCNKKGKENPLLSPAPCPAGQGQESVLTSLFLNSSYSLFSTCAMLDTLLGSVLGSAKVRETRAQSWPLRKLALPEGGVRWTRPREMPAGQEFSNTDLYRICELQANGD